MKSIFLHSALLVLLIISPALANGPTVGPNCVLNWLAVTTDTDGSAIAQPVTYNIYAIAGTGSPGSPTATGVGSTVFNGLCMQLASGQYELWVSAVDGNAVEGPVSSGLPFVVSVSPPPTTFTLTTSTAGTGSGTVSGAGIYPSGQVVAVTETPATGSQFVGWSGACSGAGSCTVTMTSDQSVTATFNLIPHHKHHSEVTR